MYLPKNTDRQTSDHLTLIYRRFRAALDLRELGVEDIARQARVSARHVWFVLKGERRPSANLLSTIRDAVGVDAWAWVCGETDVLRDTAPAVEAQP